MIRPLLQTWFNEYEIMKYWNRKASSVEGEEGFLTVTRYLLHVHKEADWYNMNVLTVRSSFVIEPYSGQCVWRYLVGVTFVELTAADYPLDVLLSVLLRPSTQFDDVRNSNVNTCMTCKQ